MKYQPPYGTSVTDAPYVNGDPSIGQQGSIPPAGAFEEPQREIINTIIAAGLTPTDADLQQLLKAIRLGSLNFVMDTGVADAMVGTLNPAIDAYAAPTPIYITPAFNNTGATTLNINGKGDRAVKRSGGADLAADDLKAGGIYLLLDNGTNYVMANYDGNTGGGGASNTYTIKIPYIADTSVTPNAITAVFSPAITALAAGDVILVKLANDITGAATITINALAAKDVIRGNGEAMGRGDGYAGQMLMLKYDGVKFQKEGRSSFVAPGQIVGYMAETPMPGTLECDGSSVLRATYPELFAVIGTKFGAVDGTHFNLPDLRGKFMRGWAHGAAADPDRLTRTSSGDGTTTGDHVGTQQADAFKSHSHSGGSSSIYLSQNNVNSGTQSPFFYVNGFAPTDQGQGAASFTFSVGNTGGNETRPTNVAAMFCIGY